MRRYPRTATHRAAGLGAVETGDWWIDATDEAEEELATERDSASSSSGEAWGEGMTVTEDDSTGAAGASLLSALASAVGGVGGSEGLTEDDPEPNDGPYHAGYAAGAADRAAGEPSDLSVPAAYADEEVRYVAGYKAGYNEISLDDVETDDGGGTTTTKTGGTTTTKTGGITGGATVKKTDDPGIGAKAGGISPTIIKWGMGALLVGGVAWGGYKLATAKKRKAA